MTKIVDNRLLLTLRNQRIVPDGTSPYYPGSIGHYIKYNTTEYWNNQRGYIPKAGEIIIYSDYDSIRKDGQTIDIPKVKIGSGNAYVQDLAFVGDDIAIDLINHITNTDVHVTPSEKSFWSRKLDIDDNNEVVNESLILIRN